MDLMEEYHLRHYLEANVPTQGEMMGIRLDLEDIHVGGAPELAHELDLIKSK